MRSECKEFEAALRDGTLGEQENLIRHAESCTACGERVSMWREMSEAARCMHRSWDSPGLWPRIERALAEESARKAGGRQAAVPFLASPVWIRWIATAACAALVILSVALGWVLLRNPQPSLTRITRPDPEFEKKILTDQALREVETAEANYVQSIEKLSKMADALLQKPTSPLLLNYRERLLILDEAIAECRANIEQNRSNAHLRKELVSIYQVKQRTLADLIKEKLNDQP